MALLSSQCTHACSNVPAPQCGSVSRFQVLPSWHVEGSVLLHLIACCLQGDRAAAETNTAAARASQVNATATKAAASKTLARNATQAKSVTVVSFTSMSQPWLLWHVHKV